MHQHTLVIKSRRGQRFRGNLLKTWEDPSPKASLPFHPPYPPPIAREHDDTRELLRTDRGL
jgi:hypothetical protein